MNDLEKKMDFLAKKNLKRYTLRVSEHLFKKIEKQILVLKYLDNRCQSKQEWIQTAVKEKIENEKEISPESIPKERRLHFKIEKNHGDYISGMVSFRKQFRESFSQKQWLIEAIQEKLEREGPKTEKLLKDLKTSTS